MTAIGYVRQSRRADLDLALSYDAQVAAIRRLAQRDGTDPDAVTLLADMGRSGGAGKERLRPAYQDLLGQIEDGQVDAVYALSLTRLARSTVELYRLMDRARQCGVRLVFEKEGILDPTSPMGKAQFGMMAVFAEFERDLAVERAQDNVAVRRARGDRMGRLPYGARPGDDPERVVAAFREAGSFNGAATILNAQGLPSPLGRKWSQTGVRLVVARYAPTLMPRNMRRGAKPTGPFRLYHLLRCGHDDRLLTAYHDRHKAAVSYKCHAADADPAHPRPKSVSEAQLMPWIMAEAARLRTPEAAIVSEANQAQRAELEARKVAILDMFEFRGIDKAEIERRLAAVQDALGAIEDQTRILDVPAIDWTWAPENINAVLRTLWQYVQLDEQLRPAGAEWLVPEWRA
jgi:DNA invertase Pin-like site-specific DNA recombinase